MVLNVDTWVETRDGTIGLVIDVSEVKRAGGRVTLHILGEDKPRIVDVDQITGQFPACGQRNRMF